MREIKVGDEVIIKDVRNVVGNNDKTSYSVEEYMANVVSITRGVGGDTWYECKLKVMNKTFTFPQWEVFLVDETTKNGYEWLDDELHGLKMFEKNINIYDTVWVDMSNWSATPPHVSGYAVVVDMMVLPDNDTASDRVMYDVQFRGSDEVITVDERRVIPIDEDEDTQEDTMHDKHYRAAVVEPILVMQALFNHDELVGFLKGNILKYRLRMGHKGTEEDMKADYDKLCVYEMWLDTIKNGERIVL